MPSRSELGVRCSIGLLTHLGSTIETDLLRAELLEVLGPT
jgi:hypothetical protein